MGTFRRNHARPFGAAQRQAAALALDTDHEAIMLQHRLDQANDLIRRHIIAHNKRIHRVTRGADCTCPRCQDGRRLLGWPMPRTGEETLETAETLETLQATQGEPVVVEA